MCLTMNNMLSKQRKNKTYQNEERKSCIIILSRIHFIGVGIITTHLREFSLEYIKLYSGICVKPFIKFEINETQKQCQSSNGLFSTGNILS